MLNLKEKKVIGSLASMSKEELEKLGLSISAKKIECLIMHNTALGALSFEQFSAFCEALKHSNLKIWYIDANNLSLPSFSAAHWNLLTETIQTLPLECLSLQHNRLNQLAQEPFEQFRELIAHSKKHRCLIANNDWSFERWNEVVSTEINEPQPDAINSVAISSGS